MTRNVSILGAGCWGVTLASLLADKKLPVAAWDINPELIQQLEAKRLHPRLPYLKIAPAVRFRQELKQALAEARYLLIAVPAQNVRAASLGLKNLTSLNDKLLVICCKGIEQETQLLLSEVLIDVLGPEVKDSICVLSGPSHAEEVARHMPTTVVAAAYKMEVAQEIQKLFTTSRFRVYTQDDIRGVQIGGAVKNVIAIAAGICDGLGYGDNTKAALLTRGIAEMVRLSVKMGGKVETLAGLAGVGDLIVTATSQHSRNRRFGQLIAQGLSVPEAQEKIGMVVEGVPTTRSVYRLAKKLKVTMPISNEVYAVIYQGREPVQAAGNLMERQPKPEFYR